MLLGIRTALKEDLSCASAELVCGISLWLPGDFFSGPSLEIHPHSCPNVLRHTINTQQFVLTDRHGSPKYQVPTDLQDVIDVRWDGL